MQQGFKFTQFRDILITEGRVSAAADLITQKLSNIHIEEVTTDHHGLHLFDQTVIPTPFRKQIRKRIFVNRDIPIQPLCIVQQTLCDDMTVSGIFRFVNQHTLHPFSRGFIHDVEVLSDALGRGHNIYMLKLPHLCELHLRTVAFAGLRGFRLLTFIAETIVHMVKLAKAPREVAGYFGLVDAVFRGESLQVAPAHIVVAPPGSGKTTTNQLYSLGYLDTDYLNAPVLDKDPSIISRLCNSGQAIMTNRWDWKEWTGLKFAVLPHNLETSLESKHIYRSDFKRMASEAIKQLMSNKVYAPGTRPRVRYDQEKWVAAYAGITNFMPSYVGYMEDGLIHHFLNLLHGK